MGKPPTLMTRPSWTVIKHLNGYSFYIFRVSAVHYVYFISAEHSTSSNMHKLHIIVSCTPRLGLYEVDINLFDFIFLLFNFPAAVITTNLKLNFCETSARNGFG